jgi:hypothetical protein
MVRLPPLVAPRRGAGCHFGSRRNTAEAARTLSDHPAAAIPSIISIDGAAIIAISLTVQQDLIAGDSAGPLKFLNRRRFLGQLGLVGIQLERGVGRVGSGSVQVGQPLVVACPRGVGRR